MVVSSLKYRLYISEVFKDGVLASDIYRKLTKRSYRRTCWQLLLVFAFILAQRMKNNPKLLVNRQIQLA
jgi:hypothetical protein